MQNVSKADSRTLDETIEALIRLLKDLVPFQSWSVDFQLEGGARSLSTPLPESAGPTNTEVGSCIDFRLYSRQGDAIGTVRGTGSCRGQRVSAPVMRQLLTVVQAINSLLTLEMERNEARGDAQQARSLAVRDSMTRLLNRRGWDAAVEDEEARLRTAPDNALVVILDLDALKATNDSAGHAQGDALIGRAAGAICASVRRNDVVARTGGDEFAILAFGMSPEEGRSLVARLRKNLDDAGVSASLGCATRADHSSLAACIAAADARMYEEKRARRASQSMARETRA